MRTPLLPALFAACSACSACSACAALAPGAAPAPEARPAAADASTPAAEAEPHPGEPIGICVFRNGELTQLAARYMPQTGDTLVDGRPFSEVHPVTAPPYAAAAEWFVRSEPIVIGSGMYSGKVKSGVPRVIPPELLQRVGEKHGVPLYAEAGLEGEHSIFYLLVRPGCVFQTYLVDYTAGAVRG